jgi:hypothetical protein
MPLGGVASTALAAGAFPLRGGTVYLYSMAAVPLYVLSILDGINQSKFHGKIQCIEKLIARYQ